MDGWLESAVNLTAETGPWRRYRDLPGLRRGRANHRLHRGSGIDSENLRSPEAERRHLGTLPVTQKPATAWSAIRLTSQPSFNPGCCYLEARGNVLAGRTPGMVRTGRRRGRLLRWGMTEWSGCSGGKRPLVPTSTGG